jgi:NitT/TauT family transport system permease protein
MKNKSERTPIFLPVLLLALLLTAWEGSVRALHIPPFVLPAPSAIYAALRDNFPLLIGSAFVTLKLTLEAFAIAFIFGLSLALAFSASRLFSSAAYPLVIALQVTPVVAIAPLITAWVGGDNPQLVTLILGTIVAFFPILSSAMIGFKSTDPALRALFRLYGASDSERFFRLEIPSALPYILSGMKISGGLALVGAVVAEMSAGSGASQGLAWRIVEAGNRLEIPRLFAAFFLLTALGVTIYGALSLLERRALAGWHESQIG